MDDFVRDPTPLWSRPAVARKTAYQRVLVDDDEQLSDDAEVAKQENAEGEEVEEEEEEEKEEEAVQEVEEVAGTTALDVGVLIEAMSKCVALYHQTNKVEFYAMVAEEYGALVPDCEDVSVDAIEQMELRLQRYAVALTRGRSDSPTAALPQDVASHAAPLARFYNTLGVTDVRGRDPGDRHEVPGDDEGRAGESPLKSPHSTGGQTDGSISNPATPQENRGEEAAAIAAENDLTTHDELPVQAPPTTSTALTEATTTTSSFTNPRSPQFSYAHATSTIAGLTKIHVESKQRLRDAEELLKAEKDRLQQVKSEYKELKSIVKQYRQRDEERKRLHHLLNGDDDDRDSDDSGRGDGAPRLPVRELRKMLRKETKHARRLQENLSLKFQLLQSENQRHHMKIEQQMAELRNEYTDSFVFGP